MATEGRCETCIPGKLDRDSFPRRDHCAANPFDVIVSNLIVLEHPSISGANYALTLTDECTSYTWPAFLERKSQTFQAVKEFDTMVECKAH